MPKTLLINGRLADEELRVAVTEDRKLEDYHVQVAAAGQRQGNIYRGIVARVEPSLNAAFIDIGVEKHGFLATGDLVESAYHRPAEGKGRPRIEDVLDSGKPVLVQVTKDAEGNKGPALTSAISLAGRYLVLTPFEETRGLSRKVEDEKLRKKVRDRTKDFVVPPGGGFIIRTNAADQTKSDLKRDLAVLLRLYKRIEQACTKTKAKTPALLYDDQDLVIRAIRDYLDASFAEVVIDSEALVAQAADYMRAVMPRSKVELKHYQGRIPLFSYFNLEPQIDTVFSRTVRLPSGGTIVIDMAEALVAVDVNSGKSTRAATQAETATRTNIEAAEMVARQLRLRDIGGLIVVDFIDMRSRKDQRAVEKALKDSMKPDRARHSLGRLSSNGLLEINRQRIHQALHQRTHLICPACAGVGRVASPERAGLYLLRRLQARAATGAVSEVRVSLHPDMAEAIQNDRRRQLAQLEDEFRLRVEIRGDTNLGPGQERLEWTKRPPGAALTKRTSGTKEPLFAAAAFALSEEECEAVLEEEQQRFEEAEEEAAESPRGSERSKRKRSSRRKSRAKTKSRGEAEPEASVEAAEGPAEAAEEPAAADSEGRSRRRRRRGKRSRRGSEGVVDGEVTGASQGMSEERADGEAAGGKSKRSRKRRGRRGGEVAAEPLEGPPAPTEAAAGAKGDGEPRTTRRRRRGRRGRRGGGGENGESGESGEGSGSKQSDGPPAEV